MKKLLCSLLAILLIMSSLSACSKQTSNQPGEKKLHIVATTFPQYDWVRQILGNKLDTVELTLLLDDGVDLHSYQPTVEDIAKISTCDMFIYVGGESDEWVHDALETASNKDMTVINLLDVLGDKVKEEEIIEGMEHTHEHSHDEIDPDNISDRALSDWNGSWTTIEKNLESGDLDEYITHHAEENETDFDTQKAVYSQRWKSDYESLTITDTSIDFGTFSSNYNYIGYKLIETDSGASVWYGFESEDESTNSPRFIAFSDHGTGGEHEHELDDEHDEEHDEEHEHDDEHEHDEEHEHDIPHFHLRYGNDSFEALTTIENWSPTFFPSDAEGSEVAEAMSGHGHSHSHEHEFDEHVWLSLKNAQIFCSYISKELERLDEQNAALYASNTEAYNTKLAELDAEYQNTVDNAAAKTLLFGDRFPFRYLVDDYGIEYYAAFSGCSAETEASFETIVFLADKTNELQLKNVMVIDNSNQSIAKTIINNTSSKNQDILILDSMQSVTAKDIASGTAYLSIMEGNLEILKKALY